MLLLETSYFNTQQKYFMNMKGHFNKISCIASWRTFLSDCIFFFLFFGYWVWPRTQGQLAQLGIIALIPAEPPSSFTHQCFSVQCYQCNVNVKMANDVFRELENGLKRSWQPSGVWGSPWSIIVLQQAFSVGQGWGNDFSSRDIWQWPETILVVRTGGSGGGSGC